jgi:DNA-directed RNA polymerase subunit alpha
MRTLAITKPQAVEFDQKASTATYGVFSAQPFERGWGVTVGNALRRILLSSIEGAAVTAVRIAGVAHELDSVPGLVEDVTDFILNLKKVPLRLAGATKAEATITVQGPGTITAADIQGGAELEVVDKTVYLGQLSEASTLEAELIVEQGRGWLPAEERRADELGIGFILVDAAFSPVRKANFRIEPARVGQATDYEKLVLEVWTNGTITPAQAVTQAANLLADHLAIFQNLAPWAAPAASAVNLLEASIEKLGLSANVVAALRNGGVEKVRDLVSRTEEEVLEIPRVGKNALAAIKKALEQQGLALGMPSAVLSR